ncbi:Ig-like domain-containing protein [Paenibacillus thailandensis]|uniref:Ig-like domain-containing protein n=1 Tax=Paenibacillus thailandensis TaxID=393250 RepID=A0ABW5QUS1_9BACL
MSSSKKDTPLKLAGETNAPVISYNVPEPTSYTGRTYIELTFPDDSFLPSAAGDRANASRAALAKSVSSVEELRKAKQSGTRMTETLAKLTEEEVEQAEREGKKLSIYRTMTGALAHRFRNVPTAGDNTLAAASRLAALPTTDGGGYVPNAIPVDPDTGGGGNYPEPKVSVSITSPVTNTAITGPHTGAPVTITGRASATQGFVADVFVKIGNGDFKTATLEAGGTWSYNTVLKTEGSVTITAKATHDQSAVTSTAEITVNVDLEEPDTVPPAVAITSPAPGQQYSAAGKDNVSVTIEGTASDARGISKVELVVGSGTPQPVDTTNGYANWGKVITLGPGNHAILARATDSAGKTSETSLTVLVDATPPVIEITSPKADGNVAGTHTKGAILEVTGTAKDDGNGIRVVEVTVDNNPVYTRAVEKAPNDWSTWKASVQIEQPGKRTITARATDLAGNTITTTIMVNVTIVPEIASRTNRIILIESYRLSSFCGQYGLGRELNTFSLLPGEKSKITVRSYTQSEESRKEASSILDSVTDEIAKEFEESIGAETSNKVVYEESDQYKLEGNMGISWGGFLSASASASTSGTTNAAREQLTKNIVNAAEKHVAKASARRDLKVETTYEIKTTDTEENVIVREIENVNMSRTLNFVFRQMNQEFITLLHLVDLRIGYFCADNNYYREVTLPELDTLLNEVIVPEKITEIRNAILNQLTNIFDYQDRHHVFVEEELFTGSDGKPVPNSSYLRVKKDYISEYYDESTKSTIKVPGIIMAANRHVLRTDGIAVDALLGQGEALDDYSRSLQEQTVREKELRNDMLEAEIKMKQLALAILEARDETAAKIYGMLNPAPVAEEEESGAAAVTA